MSTSYGANGRTESTTDNRGTTSIGYITGTDIPSSITDPVVYSTASRVLPHF